MILQSEQNHFNKYSGQSICKIATPRKKLRFSCKLFGQKIESRLNFEEQINSICKNASTITNAHLTITYYTDEGKTKSSYVKGICVWYIIITDLSLTTTLNDWISAPCRISSAAEQAPSFP